MATRSTEGAAAARRRPPPRSSHIPARPAALPQPPGPRLDPDLAEKLAGGGWDQAWQLTPTVHTPVIRPAARQETWTRERMIEPFARDALALASERSAIDLRCGEGWLAHRLLAWGARRVVGLEDDPGRLQRARLLRAHRAVPVDELELHPRAEMRPAARESFDVVLLIGEADRSSADDELAKARELTRLICAIETSGNETSAVAEAALEAGFDSVELAPPPLHAAPLYLLGERELLIARASGAR